MVYTSIPMLSYPLMERQDFTQGQLGSFKFTPVDANIINHNKSAFLLSGSAQQQEYEIIARHVTQQTYEHWQNSFIHQPESAAPLAQPQNFVVPTSPTSDPSFFNKHIKPDLAESRLRLGPAALRSAVEGIATSPHKPRHPHDMRFKTETFVSTDLHQRHSSDMNPVAPTFNPSTSRSGYSFDDVCLINQSLCRSLAAEQEAHNETQTALQEALERLEMAHVEVRKVGKQNKTLCASIQMLSGIIKHNIPAANDPGDPPSPIRIPNEQQLVKSFYDPKQPPDRKETILYDALARQRAEYERQRSSAAENGSAVGSTVQMKKDSAKVDDSDLFNLDLLKSPDLDGTRGSALRYTLRKHFLFDSAESKSEHAIQRSSYKSDTGRLIEISPEKALDSKKPTSIVPESSAAPSRIMVGTMEDLTQTMGGLQTAEAPTLEVPASFLAKYQKKGSDGAGVNSGTVKPGASAVKSEPVPLPDGEPAREKEVRRIEPREYFELNLAFNVTLESPIYKDEQAIASAKRQAGYQDTLFWKHPVRYIEYAAPNIFRTVMIDFIPLGTTYTDVINQICGGALESINLVGPIGRSTTFMTARVVFNYELSAVTTVNYIRDHGMEINGRKVRAWQVLVPTYPKNAQVDEDVFDNGYTRILLIDKVSDEILSMLPEKLAFIKGSVVEVGRTRDGLPMVEFNSVASATKALRRLVSDSDFGGGVFDFEDDPCAEPYPA